MCSRPPGSSRCWWSRSTCRGRLTSVEEWLAETHDLSSMFSEVVDPLSDEQRAAVLARVTELAQPYVDADGVVRLPARTLVAAAEA